MSPGGDNKKKQDQTPEKIITGGGQIGDNAFTSVQAVASSAVTS